ncbi:MAG: GNAT family N-acetyltransferase [Eubacteriales bacterium]
MQYIIRQVKPEEVRAALDLARSVFMEYVAPDYSEEGIQQFITDCINNEQYIENYVTGRHLMFGAFDGERIIGLISERGNGRISIVFVDKAYHRQGVATAVMEKMVVALKLQSFDIITLDSSPYAVPFYHHFGFIDTDTVQQKNGFVFTPMSYTPMELWDVYDKNRIKTGRIIERGRTMAQDEYHIVVHVWIKNSKGEYLISKRTPNKTFPDMWECTGGSALIGEDSFTAAVREAKEELGVNLSECEGKMIFSFKRQNHNYPDFIDIWLFHADIPIHGIAYQDGETCDAMWAGKDKINEMIVDGKFIGRNIFFYIDKLFAL